MKSYFACTAVVLLLMLHSAFSQTTKNVGWRRVTRQRTTQRPPATAKVPSKTAFQCYDTDYTQEATCPAPNMPQQVCGRSWLTDFESGCNKMIRNCYSNQHYCGWMGSLIRSARPSRKSVVTLSKSCTDGESFMATYRDLLDIQGTIAKGIDKTHICTSIGHWEYGRQYARPEDTWFRGNLTDNYGNRILEFPVMEQRIFCICDQTLCNANLPRVFGPRLITTEATRNSASPSIAVTVPNSNMTGVVSIGSGITTEEMVLEGATMTAPPTDNLQTFMMDIPAEHEAEVTMVVVEKSGDEDVTWIPCNPDNPDEPDCQRRCNPDNPDDIDCGQGKSLADHLRCSPLMLPFYLRFLRNLFVS